MSKKEKAPEVNDAVVQLSKGKKRKQPSLLGVL